MANRRKPTFAKQTVEEKKYPAEEFFKEKGPKETDPKETDKAKTKKEVKPAVEKTVIESVRLNLRSVPSTEGNVIKVLEPGTKLLVLDSGPEWSNVALGDSNVKGYVMTKFIK